MSAPDVENQNGGLDSSDSEAEDEKPKASSRSTSTKSTEKPEGERYDRLERLKREKRLAQNRDCARARRRRKKLRMELLENRVQELTTNNKKLQEENDALTMKCELLESQLRQAHQFAAMTQAIPTGMGLNGVPSATSFLASSSAGALRNPMITAMGLGPGAVDMDLQRRAAMVGLGGACTGLGGVGAGAGPSSAEIRYLQLMGQFKGPGAPNGQGNSSGEPRY